jgi:hypothetical protein
MDLSEEQLSVIERVSRCESPLTTLRLVFADPAEAFVCSPVPFTIRELAKLYEDTVPNAVARTRFITDLRRRSSLERWTEQRAQFQTARNMARRQALLKAEADVWAILGLEFHSKRIRGLMDRYEMLLDYVVRKLEEIESSSPDVEGGRLDFDDPLRDACKALDQVESRLVEIMPELNLRTKALDAWMSGSEGRDKLLDDCEVKLVSLRSGERAMATFDLIEGGFNKEE